MGLYIRGAEMPKTCGDCRFLVGYGEFPCYCAVGDFSVKPSETDMRDGICPLVEVKVPHGRLIDADELESKMIKTYRYFNVKFDLAEAETIIEGEL